MKFHTFYQILLIIFYLFLCLKILLIYICFLIDERYDADKNHGPCLRKGHKAHWTLVTGISGLILFTSHVAQIPYQTNVN